MTYCSVPWQSMQYPSNYTYPDRTTCVCSRCDTIDALKMFRGHCKPIWLFIIAGQTVQVMHGSNAPLLGRIIHEHMDKLKSGNPVVDSISLDDAVPGEQGLSINLTILIGRE